MAIGAGVDDASTRASTREGASRCRRALQRGPGPDLASRRRRLTARKQNVAGGPARRSRPARARPSRAIGSSPALLARGASARVYVRARAPPAPRSGAARAGPSSSARDDGASSARQPALPPPAAAPMALALHRLASLARLAGSCGVGGGLSVGRGRRLISLTSWSQGRLVAYKLADIGEGIREVTVKEWFVRPGDRVSQFDNICEVQSDKASVTITSRYDGVVRALHCDLEQTCLVGDALVDIELEADEAPAARGGQSAPATPSDRALTTPAVRKIAKENAVDLRRVPATGRDGRVLKEDILAYLGRLPGPPPQPPSSDRGRSSPEARPELGPPGGAPLADKKYAKHMWKSMSRSLTIPHFVYSDELDVSKLVKLRGEAREAFKSQGLSLSYMPFFLKAVSRALLQYPELNAWIDEESESLDARKEHNISLAMDTPGGLVVPNIKNVQDLSILDIARELNRLQALGKKSSIPLNDLTAGTFSISNIGIVGGTYTKPVILSPQVVIGAIGKIQRLPRFDEHDNVIAANILSVSWAADHRVVDGVTMARFSNLWKYYVENPSLLLLGI